MKISEVLVLTYAQQLAQTPHTGDQAQDTETYKFILREMLSHRSSLPKAESSDRPLRAKVLEWVSSEDRTTQESGIGLSAIIEAMDAQTAAIVEAIGFVGGAIQR